MCFEDMAMMRSLSNVAVLDIVDGVQLTKALPYIVEHKGTMYIRFVRKQTDTLFDDNYVFNFGKADKLADGKDITIVACGTSLFDAKKATEILAEKGISVDLLGIHTVKPLDKDAVIQSAQKTGKVLTVENHSIHGGLYSAVCETLSRFCPTHCDGIGVYDKVSQVGSLDALKRDYHISVDDIVAKALEMLGK